MEQTVREVPERIIFVGPTLYGRMPEPEPGEIWLPPAAQGDMLRAAIKHHPRQIVLIDGTFYQTLSVWTKEIVWCLLEGIQVIGAASMGALRAADTHRYGTVGIGRIFEMFRDGETEDDSLVILNYDPESFRPLSTPRVGHEAKALDALSAISFARSNTATPYTTLTKQSIGPYLEVIVERIMGE